jgi:xanthine dehydrogenase molybdopterin-binding subunit B
VRHAEEPVLLLAHPDREALLAVPATVEVEPGEPLYDPLRSTRVFKEITIRKGDAAAALAGAEIVVEGTYRTGHQEHVYIEPNGVIAVPENGGVTIHGSLQCPTTCSGPCAGCWRCRRTRCASCSGDRAAASAARRSTRR